MGTAKKTTNWTKLGEARRIPGVLINIDVHGKPYFQARFAVSEGRMVDGVQNLREREILGEPVYIGKFGKTDLFTRHPDFILAAQVIATVWPTIKCVTDEFSTERS